MKYIEVILPMPPSVNCLFSGMQKRVKSKAYRDWILKANIGMGIWSNDKISGDEWLNVTIDYYFPLYTKKWEKKIKDTANYEKATIDYLCTKIDGLEDHRIKRITQEKHDSEKDIVIIKINEIDD